MPFSVITKPPPTHRCASLEALTINISTRTLLRFGNVPLFSNPSEHCPSSLVAGASAMYLVASTAGYTTASMKHLDPTELALMLEQQESMLDWLRNILKTVCT